MISTHHQTREYVRAFDDERRARAGDLEPLVRAAARGDESAWSTIVERFTRRLNRVVRSGRIPAADVDDIVQTTFVRLYEHLDSVRDANALPGWLATTARREMFRKLSRTTREVPFEIDAAEGFAAPVAYDDGPSETLLTTFQDALDRLPEHQRALLRLLSSDEDLSYEEISQRLAIPIGSIGPTRGRAIDRLRTDPELAAVAACEYGADD
jgi:RNA polymerase sigma factor (sigma-70 family)